MLVAMAPQPPTEPQVSDTEPTTTVEPASHMYKLLNLKLLHRSEPLLLRDYLAAQRWDGASYNMIAHNLANLTEEPVTFEAVRSWCRQLFGDNGVPDPPAGSRKPAR